MASKETTFRFKEFSVEQDQCAMKIGTDGVLLGAWVNLKHHPYSILDIGAGTGIIALMLAQRSIAENIDAIELDESAYEQCVDNFENSHWNDRLFCYHADFMEFVEELEGETYDLIISNPPFFKPSETHNQMSPEREKARFTNNLSFENLMTGVSKLLADQGEFALIIPFYERENLINLALKNSLFLHHETKVKGHADSPYKRILLQLGKVNKEAVSDELIIEISRHQYTEKYTKLTKDFYLKM